MTKEQMMQRYRELYDNMANSNDVNKMLVFGDVLTWLVGRMVVMHPDIAESAISHLEASCWDSYLSEKEAMNISRRTINQDKTKGFHWNHETFLKAVNALGGVVENKPFYNSYAMCVLANNIYADHAKSIAEDMGYNYATEVPNDKMALSCYKKALEKFNDTDNKFNIRMMFKNKMYDDSPLV